MVARLGLSVARRLPDQKSISLVFGTAVFLTYTWTLFVSFWSFPSWMFFLTASQLISNYAYAFAINFIEALLLTAFVLFLCIITPGRWWLDDFVPFSVITTLCVVTSLTLRAYIAGQAVTASGFVAGERQWFLGSILVLIILIVLTRKVAFLKTMLVGLADRFTIFLYLYIPLTIAAFVLLVVRILL